MHLVPGWASAPDYFEKKLFGTFLWIMGALRHAAGRKHRECVRIRQSSPREISWSSVKSATAPAPACESPFFFVFLPLLSGPSRGLSTPHCNVHGSLFLRQPQTTTYSPTLFLKEKTPRAAATLEFAEMAPVSTLSIQGLQKLCAGPKP